MFNNKKYEEQRFDNYLRVFPKIKAIKELTFLKIHILSDVISYKVQGQPYFKSSKALAKEYGLSPKTVQKAFQELERGGYINTQPYNDGVHSNDLREAEVVDMEQWIYPDEYLSKIGFKPEPPIKKMNEGPSQWKAVNAQKKKDESKTLVPELIEIPSSIQPLEVKNILNVHSTQEIEPIQSPTTKNELELKRESLRLVLDNYGFDVHKYLTPRKLESIEKFKLRHPELTDEIILGSDKKALDDFFYCNDKVWNIKNFEEDREDLCENIHGVNYYYAGFGSRITLFSLNGMGNKQLSFQLDIHDYDKYLKKRGITFGDITLENLDTLRQHQKKSLSMYN